MNTRAEILTEIEHFLKENPDLSITRFGLEAANDGKIIPKLKAGRDITLSKLDAIRSYIAGKQVKVSSSKKARADHHTAA